MKKISLMLMVILLLTLFSGCVQTSENITKKINKLMKKQYYVMKLEEVNDLTEESYRSLDKALKGEIREFEETNSTDSLQAIFTIISSYSKYSDYITQYYILYFDRMLEEGRLEEEIFGLGDEFIEYLKNLRLEGKQIEYEEFYLNLEKYFSTFDFKMASVLTWFTDDIDQFSDEEKLFHLNALVMYENKYEKDTGVDFLAYFYYYIPPLAYSLGEEELGAKYEEKYEQYKKRTQEKLDEIDNIKDD